MSQLRRQYGRCELLEPLLSFDSRFEFVEINYNHCFEDLRDPGAATVTQHGPLFETVRSFVYGSQRGIGQLPAGTA